MRKELPQRSICLRERDDERTVTSEKRKKLRISDGMKRHATYQTVFFLNDCTFFICTNLWAGNLCCQLQNLFPKVQQLVRVTARLEPQTI